MEYKKLLETFEYKCGHLYYAVDVGTRGRIGNIAGSRNPTDGRWYIKFDGVRYGAHRLIFFFHHGWLPEEVDHEDGDVTNNNIENLRASDRSGNCCNRGKFKNNTSGEKGVAFHKQSGKWRAVVNFQKKSHTRSCQSFEEAVEVVRKLRAELHGVFNNDTTVSGSKGV